MLASAIGGVLIILGSGLVVVGEQMLRQARTERRRYKRIGNVCDVRRGTVTRSGVAHDVRDGHVQVYARYLDDDYPELGAAVFVMQPEGES